MKNFDIAVIGGGPGGYVAAIKAAQEGKKVCLIEEGELGGVCLNRGCIPTKTLLKSVQVLDTVRHSFDYGIKGVEKTKLQIDMAKLQERKHNVVKKLTGGVGMLLKANGVTVYKGKGSFIDRNTLMAGEEKITADNIIIATGSVSLALPIPIIKEEAGALLNSDQALEINEVPEKVVIIGGGVIGVEFAFIFAQLGANVVIVELMDRILPMVDEEVVGEVARMLKGLGIKLVVGAKVTKIEGNKVFYEKDGGEESETGQKILMAVGRTPTTEGLNIEAAGVKMAKKAIAVDEHLQTSQPGIYAIGDVNGKSMLAHTASMEGLIAVENILGHKTKMQYDKIPACIYTQPEIASVGMTETAARERYGEIKIGKFPFNANGKATVEGESKGMIKVIIEPRFQEILGVHIYGVHATDLIAEVVLAMNMEATAEEVLAAIHPHPTISEAVAEAFHAAVAGRAIHNV